MIFKAIIKEVPEYNSNKFIIRIPTLEDNTNKEMLFEALLCNQPGEYDGYKVGDVVFASFEDNKLDTPVILGKLYTSVVDDTRGYHKLSNLIVEDSIVLPSNTKIGGYSTEDFFKLYQKEGSGDASSMFLYDVMGIIT